MHKGRKCSLTEEPFVRKTMPQRRSRRLPQVLDCVLHPGKGTLIQTWGTKFGGSFVPFPLSSTLACEHLKNSGRHHPQLLLDCFAARWDHAGMGRFFGNATAIFCCRSLQPETSQCIK